MERRPPAIAFRWRHRSARRPLDDRGQCGDRCGVDTRCSGRRGTSIRSRIDFAARRLGSSSAGIAICKRIPAVSIDVGRSPIHCDFVRQPSVAAGFRPRSHRRGNLPPYRAGSSAQGSLLTSWSYVVHLVCERSEAKTSAGIGDAATWYCSTNPSRRDEVDWCFDLVRSLYAVAPD